MQNSYQDNLMTSDFRPIWMLFVATIYTQTTAQNNVLWADPPSRPESTFRTMGYLPDYRLATFAPQSCRHLTDLIAFSIEPQANGTLNLARFDLKGWRQLRAMTRRYHIGLHVCVGGWNRSKHFAEMARSADSRRRFIEALIQLSQRQGLTGIDIDWEHPRGRREQADYEALLTELSAAFRPAGVQLSVAAAGWQSFPPSIFQAVDRIHLMSYDAPQRHATLEKSRQDIARYLEMGCPAKKLCLCLPFYGRHIEKRTAHTYAEIVAAHHPDDEIDEIQGIYFNGPRTIQSKTHLAINRQLAGVCVWELGQDTRDGSSLLSTIAASRKRVITP